MSLLASHPTGVRGLKLHDALLARLGVPSHPTGVRGLKYPTGATHFVSGVVAPHWGAWIEISRHYGSTRDGWGRTPLGCVD